MLKVVVFDSGYGGELFADRLAEELPILDIVRVIDWRHAEEIQSSSRLARKFAERALRPYIGEVDLIILANHLLTATSLKYFRRRYQSQKFVGLRLCQPTTFVDRNTIVLTTRPLAKTINYHNYTFRLHRSLRTLTPDDWLAKIDDGQLSDGEVCDYIASFVVKENFTPEEVILACAHFSELKTELHKQLGRNLKIHDSFDDAIRHTCKALHLRGGIGKKKK